MGIKIKLNQTQTSEQTTWQTRLFTWIYPTIEEWLQSSYYTHQYDLLAPGNGNMTDSSLDDSHSQNKVLVQDVYQSTNHKRTLSTKYSFKRNSHEIQKSINTMCIEEC